MEDMRLNVIKGIEVRTRSRVARQETFMADDFLVGAHKTIDGTLYFEALARNVDTGKYVWLQTEQDFDTANEKVQFYKRRLMEERLKCRGIETKIEGYI